jgi:hypothetical protein
MGNDNRPWIWIGIAFLVGLLIGWLVLGWWIWPLEWTNAHMRDVRPEEQKVYLAAVAEAYELTGDREVALERLAGMGSQEYVTELAADLRQESEAAGDIVTADRITTLATAFSLDLSSVEVPDAGVSEPGQTPVPSGEAEGVGGVLWGICRAALGLLVILAGIVLALYLLRRRSSSREPQEGVVEPGIPPDEESDVDTGPVVESTPPAAPPKKGQPVSVTQPKFLAQEHVATFNMGDVSYDQSFDIEDPETGAYLGECGMTMSELINGDPNRVTALEVWLFDKSDIRTVTKVLMSDYAFGNQSLREKLSSRGDAILLDENLGFVLDAQTLRLEGQVLGLDYDDTEAPSRSTLQRLSVRLRVIRQAA